ncbi:GNAT family N-acetyltransferase [Carboxylicivirga sp. A043]|uniref:GNAT family N-acetyltransferase n=1 Tax=Carboxylicivirga litoralis TaxID=2816963 RepID=UPI0021CB1296|nr:GNAT family N-acetyltransferase [Carboxylicivirga sp. A043]MCU4155616.1 GNAT family N-acetyltransferase [Carboxylicivirga sp. A043]
MNTIYFELPLIEWIGYIASTIVLISLSLSSIVKLRIFNLIGSAIFSFYGFYIGALPVGIMNFVICLFNIYYLRSLLFKKEVFEGIWSEKPDGYLHLFLNYHKKDIQRFFPDFKTEQAESSQILMAVRDMNVAGVMLLSDNKNGTAEVLLDYVTPQYRDYKTGKYLLKKFRQLMVDKGLTQLNAHSNNEMHIKYLQRVGFEKVGGQFELKL